MQDVVDAAGDFAEVRRADGQVEDVGEQLLQLPVGLVWDFLTEADQKCFEAASYLWKLYRVFWHVYYSVNVSESALDRAE